MSIETHAGKPVTREEPGGSRGYTIERLQTNAGMDRIRTEWIQLADSIPGIPLFRRWEWGSTWWRHFGAGNVLWLLAAWDECGELAGLAPFMLVEDRVGPLKIRRLTFLSYGLAAPDHLDILARVGEEDAVAAAFLEYLTFVETGWDVLDLDGLEQGGAIERALANSGLPVYESLRKQVCPYIQLPDSWEDYLRTTLSSRRRSYFRRLEHRLNDAFPDQVAYEFVTGPEDVAAALQRFSEISRAYWQGKGHSSAFHDSRFEAFHQEMAVAANRRGWLRLFQMKVNDQVIAIEYNFRSGDAIYGYQGVFDREWARYSPGHLLLIHAFQQAIAEGVAEFDFLRGDEEYKFYWTDAKRLEGRMIYPRSRRGRVWLSAVAAMDRGILLARQVFSKPARDKAARLLSALQRKKQPAGD